MNYKHIPIYIIVYNRLTCLKLQISFFQKCGYSNIICIDNNTTYKPTLEYLDETKQTGIQVIKTSGEHKHGVFWNDPLFAGLTNQYYVVTDPDVIPYDTCPDNFVEYFYNILQEYSEIPKVGFGLSITDLPDTFKHKKVVIDWEQQFWTNKIRDGLYKADIDTTFALYRPGPASGWSKAIRTDSPYLAKHYTWYLDNNNLPEDEKFYKTTIKNSTHWSIQN